VIARGKTWKTVRSAACLAALAFALAAVAGGCSAEVGPNDYGQGEPTGQTAQASSPLAPMTPSQIVALGSTVVGYSYWWGHGSWDPTALKYPGKCTGNCGKCTHAAFPAGGHEYGSDCSGFVSQAWKLPNTTATTVDPNPHYTTGTFRNSTTYWTRINRSELRAGDALVYNNGSHGHIVLIDHADAGHRNTVYECYGCAKGCIHDPRNFGSAYIAIRRNDLQAPPAAGSPQGQLESAACSGIKGYAYDASDKTQTLNVEIDYDAPYDGTPSATDTVPANQQRSDLTKKIGSPNHGFTDTIPQKLQDGKKHSVYAYAIGIDGTTKRLLLGAPRSIECGSPSGVTCGQYAAQQGWSFFSCKTCNGQGVKTTDCAVCCSSCVKDTDCPGGEVCATNGDGYCCRKPGAAGTLCEANNECPSGQVCAWNGTHYYCAAPACN
jgi:cell wall-associated NlpC family hydrolase